MQPAIKFCGLTRAVDAAYAAELGAGYCGVIFAESPRRLTIDGARRIYDAARARSEPQPRAVAVFGRADVGTIAATALAAGADVIQLHGDPDDAAVALIRKRFAGEIWAVTRIGDGPPSVASPAGADGVVLDTADARRLGGTGRPFDWSAVADALASSVRPRKLVLAGGLRPSNVGDAIRLLLPDVVDVSSGVESSTGIKDHALMRDFVAAVAKSGRL